ncbi:MAG: alanyl-tRNA editing protein [Treponema sp.]|jgi:alanyl-tRNA synthetase|nr:alanyl-tRNA editing protein [Treponema sp.]
MQTEKLYYSIPLIGSLKAEIMEIIPYGEGSSFGACAAVVLDRTIFYPEGGGQNADRGTINGIALLDVQEKDGRILHILSSDKGLVPGPAELVLDTRRRRDLTVQHTAQHLLSGTILRLSGKPTLSMHLGDEACTIDVGSLDVPETLLLEAEDAAARIIEEDHPVIIHFCPPEDIGSFPLRKVPPQGEEIIRVVEIEGNDFSPCCGTHCASTGRILMLRILSAEKHRGMTRISFIAGLRCLYDSRMLRKNVEVISRALKTPAPETGSAVLALLEKTAGLERQIKTCEEENAVFKAKAMLHRAGIVPDAVSAAAGTPAEPEGAPVEGSALRLLVERIPAGIDEALLIGRAAQKLSGAAFVLISERDLKFAAFCSAKDADLRALLKAPMEAQGGRGGGSSSFFQGLFPNAGALSAFTNSIKRNG